MGSFTHADQLHMDGALKRRDQQFGISYKQKAAARADIPPPGVHESKFLKSLLYYLNPGLNICRCGLLVEIESLIVCVSADRVQSAVTIRHIMNKRTDPNVAALGRVIIRTFNIARIKHC